MSDTILHIASDYPGPFSPQHVTVAVRDSVRSLEPEVESFILVPRRHRKLSKSRINRIGNELHVSVFDPIPHFIGGKDRLEWLKLTEKNLLPRRPSLVHSHKLSYEALIGDMLAQSWNVPHIVTIRGSSDTHWRNNLPFTKSIYRDILERSTNNLWLSMWAQRYISEKNGYILKEKDLPFPTGVPFKKSNSETLVERPNERRLICVARLDDYKQKGLLELIEGFSLALKTEPELQLDIIGPATAVTRQTLANAISSAKLENQISVKEPLPRIEVIRAMASCTAFILLPTKETFGLVFIEALLSGVPIVFLKDSGVDGYDFANRYGVRASSRAPHDVSQAILEVSRKASDLRIKLQADILQGKLGFFEPTGMKARYLKIINSAIDSHQ